MNPLRLIIGLLVFFSSFLGLVHSPAWLYFAMFVGLNLVQFSFTGWCPLELALRKLHK
ncbi:DUF2892 domain-containing protein [Candidatus Woesearchaeota archaeon]|nr:DUF2892 domain-containing protein [Candidatus Woesearchaeota archaeon]